MHGCRVRSHATGHSQATACRCGVVYDVIPGGRSGLQCCLPARHQHAGRRCTLCWRARPALQVMQHWASKRASGAHSAKDGNTAIPHALDGHRTIEYRRNVSAPAFRLLGLGSRPWTIANLANYCVPCPYLPQGSTARKSLTPKCILLSRQYSGCTVHDVPQQVTTDSRAWQTWANHHTAPAPPPPYNTTMPTCMCVCTWPWALALGSMGSQLGPPLTTPDQAASRQHCRSHRTPAAPACMQQDHRHACSRITEPLKPSGLSPAVRPPSGQHCSRKRGTAVLPACRRILP
jgi:hypothetical protein